MREAQIKVQEADSKMIESMTECSELLTKHYRRYRKLPQSVAEFDVILSKSKLYTAKNPYFENELLRRELPPTASHLLQFTVNTDYALFQNELAATAKNPPKSWTGVPGTIAITQNSERSFAVRGYGMDNKPIQDRTASGAFYIFKDCSELDN